MTIEEKIKPIPKWLIVPLCCILFLVGCTSPRKERDSNFTQGNKIVAAISAFQKKYDSPPAALGALVPEYLSTIPNTYSGADFIYAPFDEDTYGEWSLTFDVSSDGSGCTYISHFQFWDCWPSMAGKED